MVFRWFRREKPAPHPSVPVPPVTPRVPHWAPYLSIEQQRRVEELSAQWFRDRGDAVETDIGFLRVGTNQYGLENVAQRCRPLPFDEWPMCVADHFGGILAAEEEQRLWDERCGDFAWVAPLLRLRFYPWDYLTDGRENLALRRRDFDDTFSLVVADLPRTVMAVDPALTATWGRSADEVFGLALEQTLRECPIEWEQVDLGAEGGGAVLHVASADHFFVTTHALRIGSRSDLLAPAGVLVAMPDRQTMLALPVAGNRLAAAIQQFVRIVLRRYQQGPGSVSPHLYWRRPDGTFATQRCELADGAPRFSPMPEFAAVLARLVPPA
jgi:hypothetical protein